MEQPTRGADAPALKYIELKTGFSDDGPAWIARVSVSKSGRTVYFGGKALRRAKGLAPGNYVDVQTGDAYWVSGVKKRGTNRHWAGSAKIIVEAAAVPALLAHLGETTLDPTRFVVSDAIRPTSPSDFASVENPKPDAT
ncbi:MAG: hypothetical protein LAO05_18425 [Acidobacteriia bacterium]|nr:hypothetical protein [Terriglobia bacterium]